MPTSQALDLADAHSFWLDVARENATTTDEERADYLNDGTIGDNIADANDDELSREDAW